MIAAYKKISCIIIICMAVTALLKTGGYAMKSSDGYIKHKDSVWTFGTSKIERCVEYKNGRLYTKYIKNQNQKTDVTGNQSEVFSFGLNTAENRISSINDGWKLVNWKAEKLKQKELQLDIILQSDNVEVIKTYVIYPKTSIIREWAVIKNVGDEDVIIIEPSYLDVNTKVDDVASTDFNWMTGAENFPGSWTLRTEKLESGNERKIDSYDPSQLGPIKLLGDGVNAKILKNDIQVWPETGWAYTSDASVTVPFDFEISVEKGDKLTFTTNINDNFSNDTTAFNPTITYSDGESHNAAAEFGEEQGLNNWKYCYIENGNYVDLRYYPIPKQWRKKADNHSGTPFVGIGNQHPHPEQDAALVWTANKDGKIKIQGGVTNTGNASGISKNYGYKMNSQTYAPWFALKSDKSKNGMFIGYDFFGHNLATFVSDDNGNVQVKLRVAGHNQTLKPGEEINLPKGFTGLFNSDIDEAGNECLNWQYRYMWDYTRKDWFPAIRMLGYWMRGTAWGSNWLGGNGDWHSVYQKIFRTTDLMRYVGADVFHRDWGWWDRAGDWNGPDFKSANEYLRKYDMGLLIYAFLYTVDPESKVAKEHPDWLLNDGVTLDMSQPEVIDFMRGQLDTFRAKWGTFEWRNDSNPFSPKNGDDTILLGQDIGFRRLLKEFLDKHQDCAFQAVNGGGYCAGYDYVHYSSTIQFTDGGAGLLGNYYTTLLFPPDKTNHMPDSWNPDAYNPATFHGLLCGNFDMTGDTWDPEKLEGLRDMMDVYHYLEKEGVVGRWVKVYRPKVDGDDPTMYYQRMDKNNKKGIIITKHLVENGVTIYPKGLISDAKYDISYHYKSGKNAKRTGNDLMKNGISLDKVAPGELIYLNIPLHPGNSIDKEAPSEPKKATKKESINMGYVGVELKWSKAKDNNWISYYEIYRDGRMIDKVSKGQFYFDHSAGADLAADYEIRAVDSAGNVSGKVDCDGKSKKRAQIFDDRDNRITYNGNWSKVTSLPAYNSMLTVSSNDDDYFELEFEGSEIRWFSKLGDSCGKAAISIDGGSEDIIDTYAADDVWGVCLYSKKVTSGKHTIRIRVTGERNGISRDKLIYNDGFQVR